MNTEVIETEETPSLPEQFTIDSDSAAEWLLRKLNNNNAEKARVLRQAQEIVTALDNDTASLLFRHGAALENYCREKLAAGGNKVKTVRFLQGTCNFRYSPPAAKVKDADAALRWCKENAPALVTVETVEKFDGDLFRKQAEQTRTKTGELLPGVEFSEGGDLFNILYLAPPKGKKKTTEAAPASTSEE